MLSWVVNWAARSPSQAMIPWAQALPSSGPRSTVSWWVRSVAIPTISPHSRVLRLRTKRRSPRSAKPTSSRWPARGVGTVSCGAATSETPMAAGALINPAPARTESAEPARWPARLTAVATRDEKRAKEKLIRPSWGNDAGCIGCRDCARESSWPAHPQQAYRAPRRGSLTQLQPHTRPRLP